MPKQQTTRRATIPTLTHVGKRHGSLVVRYEGTLYALIPLAEIERMEDEQDLRDARRAERRIRLGLEKTIPFEQVRRELGLDRPARARSTRAASATNAATPPHPTPAGHAETRAQQAASVTREGRSRQLAGDEANPLPRGRGRAARRT